MFADDSDREAYFEAAIVQASRDFQEDNTNAKALLQWGGALLELAHYKQGDEAIQFFNDAIDKFNQSLAIDPGRNEANWCIGNAYVSLGFLQQSRPEALEYFQKAKDVLQACVNKEPNNEPFRKALEMCEKAPEYYDEVQAQMKKAQAAAGAAGGKRSSGTGGGAKDPLGISDFWWDAAGWVLLVAAIGGIAVLSRSGAAAPKA